MIELRLITKDGEVELDLQQRKADGDEIFATLNALNDTINWISEKAQEDLSIVGKSMRKLNRKEEKTLKEFITSMKTINSNSSIMEKIYRTNGYPEAEFTAIISSDKDE